jgi:hypothetical protein
LRNSFLSERSISRRWIGSSNSYSATRRSAVTQESSACRKRGPFADTVDKDRPPQRKNRFEIKPSSIIKDQNLRAKEVDETGEHGND